MADELIPKRILNFKVVGKRRIRKCRDCRMDGMKNMMGIHEQGTVEEEDRFGVKENHCIVEDTLIRKNLFSRFT